MKRLAYKTLSAEIQAIADVDHVVLPLRQTEASGAKACVEPDQAVERGQRIGEAEGPSGAALHSPLSGTVTSLFFTLARDGRSMQAVRIEGRAAGELSALEPLGGEPGSLDAEVLRTRLEEAGVSPLGGEGRNARLAVLRPAEEPPDTLVVLCSDEDPLLQTQRQVLREAPEKVIEGATLFQKAVGAGRLVFAVPPDLKDLVSGETVLVEGRYPAGLAELLMARMTGRHRMPGRAPRDDVFAINAETALAVRAAVREGVPLTEKVVTVGADGGKPLVVRVPVGTPFSRLLTLAGLEAQDGDRLLTGGPLRGEAQFDEGRPVTKGTDGLFLQKAKGLFTYEDAACIGCGACVKVCPVKIPVNMMTRNCEHGRIAEAVQYDLECCIECGLCAYVCTARRPLLQYIQFAKQELEKMRSEEA